MNDQEFLNNEKAQSKSLTSSNTKASLFPLKKLATWSWDMIGSFYCLRVLWLASKAGYSFTTDG